MSEHINKLHACLSHKEIGNAVSLSQWKTICDSVRPVVAALSVDDLLGMQQNFQDRVLNLAFSNSLAFDVLEPLIAPLWKEPKNLKHLMRAIFSTTRDPDPHDSQWVEPFVVRSSVLNVPEIVAALKLYPHIFNRVFLVRPQFDITSDTVDGWLKHTLCTHEDLVEWAIAYGQEDKLTHLTIPQSAWDNIFATNDQSYFINKILKLAPKDTSARNAWNVVSKHLVAYDCYENTFGDWGRTFCSELFACIAWDTEKMRIVFERAVGAYSNLDFGEAFECLYECMPQQSHHLLYPYLLMFDFKRSTQLKALTQELEDQQQHTAIYASLPNVSASKIARKM